MIREHLHDEGIRFITADRIEIYDILLKTSCFFIYLSWISTGCGSYLPHLLGSMFHLMGSFLSLLFCRVSINALLECQQITFSTHCILLIGRANKVRKMYYLMLKTLEGMYYLTRSVPLTVCEFSSRILLHEKHVFSSHRFPVFWCSQPSWDCWTELAVSPVVCYLGIVRFKIEQSTSQEEWLAFSLFHVA